MTEQTNIYQCCFVGYDGAHIFSYFQVMEELRNGYVRVRGLGELWVNKTSGERVWKPDRNHDPNYPDYPYPICAKPRYWKGSVASEGDDRIYGGRILRTKHGGGSRERTDWISLAECYPPPEFYN
jgi:hypothetical protein